MKILLILIFKICYAQNENSFHQTIFLGEWAKEDYYGPKDERWVISQDGSSSVWRDEFLEEEILYNTLAPELFPLKLFIHEKLPFEMFCPNSLLYDSIGYIRYIYRLFAISYYFEELKFQKTCPLSYDLLFSQCRPRSSDMKTFLTRAKVFLDKEKFKLEKSTDTCLEIRQEISSLCSEVDDYFGLSERPEISKILGDSNVAAVINHNSNAVHCLPRFVELTRRKERIPSIFYNILDRHLTKLKEKNARYLEGELFLPGALKDFDDQGLNDFLFVEEKKKIIPQALPEKKKNSKRVVWVPAKKITPIVNQKKAPPKMPKKEEKKVDRSAFEEALSIYEMFKSDRVAVNMKKMKEDFIFSEESQKIIQNAVYNFQSQKILTVLKSKNNLGSKKGPLRLSFVKYMIDASQHQGLFNLKMVLGDRFFVINDLEEKNEAVFIELALEENNIWQIYIRKVPDKVGKK